MSRLIDAYALMDYCNNQKVKAIDANDIARFPTVGGWISAKDRMPDTGTLCFAERWLLSPLAGKAVKWDEAD